MATGLQTYFTGTIKGDHTGDDIKDIFDKQLLMFKELMGSATNSYKAVTLTAASTDDYDPWGAAPPQDFRLDINPTTNDVVITSLRAGFDGQRGSIRNVGTSGYVISCTNAASTGTAANRFYGTNDAGAGQAAEIRLLYSSLPTPRWYIG